MTTSVESAIVRWTYKEMENLDLRTKFQKQCSETNYAFPTQRNMVHYFHIFSDARGNGLEIFLARLTRQHQHHQNLEMTIEPIIITYLDCGAGQGLALDDFLTGRLYEMKVDIKATGISLHHFTNIALLLETHKEKLEWFFGKADNVLLTLLSNSYDLITDCWGAYFYSLQQQQRTCIIQNYYRLLRPGGNAYIMLGRSPGLERERYEHYFVKKWPSIFKLRCNLDKYEWLTIYKRSIDVGIKIY